MLSKSNGNSICLMQCNGNNLGERPDQTYTELSELPGGCSSSNPSFVETLSELCITRFKGLGKISLKEFAQFIVKEMRLSKVEYAPRAESCPIFNFYMGKNTPERKDYIMDKLVVSVEE